MNTAPSYTKNKAMDLNTTGGPDAYSIEELNTGAETLGNKTYISIVDIDLNVPQGGISYADLINSPRTLEAMATLGHEPEELDDITYADIREMLIKRERKQSVPKMVVDLRFDNEQKKRHDKKQAIVMVSNLFSCELF